MENKTKHTPGPTMKTVTLTKADLRAMKLESFILNEMCDDGELSRKGDWYEDMGGHMSHESWMGDYIKEYLNNTLSTEEREELYERFKQGDSQ